MNSFQAFDRPPNIGVPEKYRFITMSNNTSIELGGFGDFVDSQVKTRRYGSKSEVIRAGLRLLQERETKLEALRVAVREGVESGSPEHFDFDEFVKEVRESR